MFKKKIAQAIEPAAEASRPEKGCMANEKAGPEKHCRCTGSACSGRHFRRAFGLRI